MMRRLFSSYSARAYKLLRPYSQAYLYAVPE